MKNFGEIVIYTKPEGQTDIAVTLQDETIWMTEKDLSLLFERNRTVIGRHIKNIFESGELDEKSNVQKIRIANSDKPVSYYNLDVIISVGYRVNSKKGTQFRIWANKILKDHLVEGYSINEKRLKEKNEELQLLKSTIQIIERSLINQAESLEEAKSLVRMMGDFSKGLNLLDDYDHESLDISGRTKMEAFRLTLEECYNIIDFMKSEFSSELFGKPKDESFESSINQIYQGFSGQEIYPSIEEKAAMLLYFIVKNHSFIDGNKRIGAAIFLHFLNQNGLLYDKNGKIILSNEGLAALTLMIAESKPDEMETMKKVVVSILNRIGDN